MDFPATCKGAKQILVIALPLTSTRGSHSGGIVSSRIEQSSSEQDTTKSTLQPKAQNGRHHHRRCCHCYPLKIPHLLLICKLHSGRVMLPTQDTPTPKGKPITPTKVQQPHHQCSPKLCCPCWMFKRRWNQISQLPDIPAITASSMAQEKPQAQLQSQEQPQPQRQGSSQTLPRPQPNLLPHQAMQMSLLQPPKEKQRTTKTMKVLRPCHPCPIRTQCGRHSHGGGNRMAGTLFGNRKAHVSFAIQENPRCLPTIVIELAIETAMLLQQMAQGHVKIALECEKRPGDKTQLLEEPVWNMFCNGRKTGCATKREATNEDLKVLQLLNSVSMGAGVLPKAMKESLNGELTYMRAQLERVVGSKDSQTFYMLNPDENSDPELSVVFIRIG